jgi:hypothetical protein
MDRAALVREFEAGRAAGDVDAMAAAALAMAEQHQFGIHLGRTPAYVHEAYTWAAGAQRVRLAVALARLWVYGNEPARAVPFANEAVANATEPALLADALDAALLVHWGPDEMTARRQLTARLEDTVAHLPDVEARLKAHLWRLTVAVESLDAVTAQRQLRALDELADESGQARVRFFATSRRAMWALVVGDLAAAEALTAQTVAAGELANEADTEALQHELTAWRTRQTGDQAALAAQAAEYEEYGMAQGVPSIAAEGAALWLESGAPDRARALLDKLAGGGLATLPRDVEWLATVAILTEVAAGTGSLDLAAEGVDLLTPFAGRAVLVAGAVALIGVVDDTLRIACTALGRDADAARWGRSAAACYQRLGAAWWLRRLALPPAGVAHLVPGADGVWSIGSEGALTPVREMKGFRYLRLLLERPGVEVSALELTEALGGATVFEAGFEVLDRQAMDAYRRRITEIDTDIAEAEQWADQARLARLSAERGMLLDEVGAATGLGGRTRTTGSSAERARVAVQKALAAALKRIGEVDPSLGRLLRDTVRTGNACVYEPDPSRPLRWVLQ